MKKKGSISPMEALAVYKIPRLAARIEELRDEGMYIISLTRRDGLGARYTRYTHTR